jgi:hypothetical protein
MRRRSVVQLVRVAIASLLAAVIVGCGGENGPTLHRPARAIWCPSRIVHIADGQLREAGHGHFDARALIGRRAPAAARLAAKHECTMPVTLGDKAVHVLTMDWRTNRINVHVHRGRVDAIEDVR